MQAKFNLRRICDECLGRDYELTLIDIEKHPELTAAAQVFATPLVVRLAPPPRFCVVGDISDATRVRLGLGISNGHAGVPSRQGARHRHSGRRSHGREACLRRVIDCCPDALVIVGATGVVQFVNPAAGRLFGGDHSSLVGQPFGLPLCTGESTDVDIVARDGRRLIAEMRVVATEWDNKTAWMALLREITERRRAEEALRENEKRLTLAMEAANLYFTDMDVRTGAVFGDDKLLSALGYQRSESAPTREAWHRLIHPDDLPGVWRAFEASLTGETEAFREQFRLRAKSGEWRWFRSQSEVVEREPNGAALRVIGVNEDITERKRAELAFEAAQAKLRLAVEVARVGFWEWNPATGDTYFSREWKKQLGYADDELASGFEEFAARLHPEDREPILSWLGVGGADSALEVEYRLRHKDGSYRWIAARMLRLGPRGEKLPRLLGTHLDITERKESEERIRQISQHDPLTGLPNRALVYEFAEHVIAAARRTGTLTAFLFVDLDRFKPVNDTYGHDVGDAVLKQAAQRLDQCVRGGDLAARLGGDEFLAVLAQLPAEEDAAQAARHAVESLGRPYEIDGLTLTVTPSIGISLFPQDGERIDDLIKRADAAMYLAKESGHNNFQFFKQTFNLRAEEALRIEGRLREGLARREFVLFYQAVIDVESEHMVGAEALLRWPAMNSAPERFIPVAEKAGFMRTLGAWVVQEACRQQRAWHDNGVAPFPVAVNVSPIEFQQKNFADNVGAVLQQYRLGAHDISMEVTESTVMKNVDEATDVLRDLRAMGIRMALDDFGTGYSSLSLLSRLPIDTLKLDQSFIKGIGRGKANTAVAEGIIALARSLDLEVVAEGVESTEALDFLRRHRCRLAQGFHFCRPMSAAGFERCYGRRHGQSSGAGATTVCAGDGQAG